MSLGVELNALKERKIIQDPMEEQVMLIFNVEMVECKRAKIKR